MPRLRQNQRVQAATMLAAGQTAAAVARAFGCHRNTISRLQQRFHATGDVVDRPRTGRPRVTTARTDRFMTLTHLRRRFKTASSTAREYGISSQTVINRLRKNCNPIRPRRPYVGQIINNRNRNARVLWGRRHLRWRRAQWATVLFSDESRFNLSHADGRIRVYRRKGERFADACLLERDRFGGGSVMVWGGIMGGRKTELVVIHGNINAQSYINNVLQPTAVPFLQRHGPGILMQDNARPHTARLTRNFLEQNNVRVLPWPASSPDMNPIEHIWDELGRKVRSRHIINNVRDLTEALVQEWNRIPEDVIRRYVQSMRRRIVTLLHKRGGHNRY